ncbi:cytochrome P450 [Pyrrhoderma noxium]|uniref:Cytochrome P450 n=1 Tax=Pyrrhoderma noxium TaxID=2282107 RepID=A0A286UTF2_9AGAM|nr:cytochrome P450 [Pyrrhoderma noxium]
MAKISYILASILGFLSHYAYRRKEPTVARFIFSLAHITLFLLAQILLSDYHDDLTDLMSEMFKSLIVYHIFLCTSIGVYRASPWHPLAKFDGPRMACLSKMWTVRLLLKGDRYSTYSRLHTQYGAWVRTGPNELSVNLTGAILPIYSTLSRSSFYRGIPAKVETLITMVGRKEHTARKRPWIKALSGENLHTYFPVANKRTAQFIEAISHHSSKQGPIDIGKWISLLLMDMIGEMSFTDGFEMVKEGRDVEGWIATLELGAKVVGVLGQIPWFRDIIELIPQKGPIEKFHEFTYQKVQQARDQPDTPNAKKILSLIIHKTSLTDGEATADASLLIASSVETTTQALVTLIRQVYSRPDILSRIRNEICDVFGSDWDLQDLDLVKLNRLDYLGACIKEALRIRPPAPSGPPRTTGDNHVVIQGVTLPPNTTLHVPTWTLHHDPSNFKDPDSFIPERWLTLANGDGDIIPHNQHAYIPFSSGFGVCPGKHLALQNIKVISIYIFHRLNINLSKYTSLEKFDSSYRECGLWLHEPLLNYLFIPFYIGQKLACIERKMAYSHL